MTVGKGYDTYKTNHYEGMSPNRLILLLYNGAIKHIRLARQGINEQNIRMRGENLSRAIAIVSELNACLDPNIKDEAIDFLRGLYRAILTELPKVSITNDIKILDRSEAYITQLKDIWENNVLKKQQLVNENKKMSGSDSVSVPDQGNHVKADSTSYNYQRNDHIKSMARSISA